MNLLAQGDTTYVKPDELEYGWGLYWTDSKTEDIPIPYLGISSISVSPNGKWLAFRDNSYLQVMNLQTKEIKRVSSEGFYSEWSPDSKILSFVKPMFEVRSLFLYFLLEDRLDSITCLLSDNFCSFGSKWAIDNYIYFSHPLGYPPPDSLVFRVNVDSSLKSKHPVHELMDGIKYKYIPIPFFPTISINYFVSQNNNDEINQNKGFDVTINFDYNLRTKIRIPIPDTNWIYCGCNTFGMPDESNLMQVGPRGDVYLYLSFRAKKEWETTDENNNRCNPKYWDSSTIAARNASGWYRVDTNGFNLVQLVRSWSLPIGGISISRDGEAIYYGFLQQDTCISIMKMNRFGRNKELVFKLEKETSVSSELNYLSSNDIISIQNPINKNEIRITVNKEFSQSFEFSIFDLYGKKIIQFSNKFTNNPITINTSDFIDGIYFLTYNSTKYSGALKFLLLH